MFINYATQYTQIPKTANLEDASCIQINKYLTWQVFDCTLAGVELGTIITTYYIYKQKNKHPKLPLQIGALYVELAIADRWTKN